MLRENERPKAREFRSAPNASRRSRKGASRRSRKGASRRSHKGRRRAVAMAAVLVCLLVIMLIGTTLVRGMLLQHRQTKTQAMQVQALWLAESAAALATQQLRADPAYTGETWRANFDDQASTSGIVVIDVQPVDQQPRQRLVQIKSTYPDDPVHRVVLENEIIVTLPASGDSA